MSSKDENPIAVDEKYNVRDNQFWYNDCNFRTLIENKSAIKVRIEGHDDCEYIFRHSKHGIDGRITLSYTIPECIQEWWQKHHGEFVRVELLEVD